MNEKAKQLWDMATQHLESACETDDAELAACYTSIGELALKAAQFALNNPALVLGIDESQIPGMPIGAPPLPGHIVPGAPRGKVWGQ